MALSRDARLVARVRRGDAAAFEALHARHQPAVLSFCRHLTGSREDAEDAVQHTFLAAYRKIVESDERIDLRPWLYAVARNRCVSLLRARRESAVAEPDRAATSLEGLAAEVERRQDLRDLVGDLARLPEEQRAALVLSQLDALSYREIGGVLGVEPAKVKALVFQARSSLASTREARDAPCAEIRQEIATARGAGMRRRLLRRHVGQCDGCREFEVAMQRQRHQLDVLLPAIPSAGLAQGVLGGALGREGAATGAGAGGAAAVGGGGGLSGIVAALGVGGATKLAVVATVVAGGGVSAAVASDLPERLGGVPLIGGERVAALEDGKAAPGDENAAGPERGVAGPLPGRGERTRAGGPGHGDESDTGDAGDGVDRDDAAPEERADGGGGPGEDDLGGAAPGGGDPGYGDGAADGGLPPGLAKRGSELPPGLAKRGGELPPGLAKRLGVSPGQSGGPASPGRGNGGSPPGQAGAGQGNGNGGGNGKGNGSVGGGGQGNGKAGQGAGQGNGNGNAGDGGQGNGGGGPGAGSQGNGGGGSQGNGSGGQGNGSGGVQGNGGAGQGGGQANGNGGAGGQANGNGGPKPK